MTEIGYYNYYNVKGRYSPEVVQDRYKEMVEAYNSGNLKSVDSSLNPYSESNQKIRALDEKLAPMAESIRNQCKTVDDVRHYLCKKYFGQEEIPFTKKWDEPEKYAMYHNDMNAVLYGTISTSLLFDDPRLDYKQTDWEEQEELDFKSRHDSISLNMKNLLTNNNIKLDKNDSLLISINPYDYSVNLSGINDSNLLLDIKQLLEAGSNSKNLLHYALNSSTNNKDAIVKMRAYSTLKEYTGLDLSKLTLKDGEYYSVSGEKVSDVLKEKLDKNNDIASEFKSAAYNYTMDLVNQVAEKGWNSMPDLSITIGYNDSNGFISYGKTYEV